MNLQEIKKQLPTGAETEIGTIAQISSTTVKKVLMGIKAKPAIELKVLNATAQYLKTYKEQKATALQELQAVAGL